MTILESDIILLASQVMDDVPEGGGAATGNVIVDGVSNNMFPDISELDHTLGRVQLRKVFLGINTPTVDTYLGANFIVMKPPVNTDVSAVLFSTGDDFDTRDAAASRIEAYLTTGPVYPGELFGNHIEGQSTVTLQQRTSEPMPNVGDTIELVLFAGDGVTQTHSQYVRIIDLSSQVRTFTTTDGSGNPIDFQRNIVSLIIGSTLDHDYAGFDPINVDANINYGGKTKLYTTVVADAAQYYGVVALTAAASFGDTGVRGDGIFTQLVPSSRTEIAIPDARMNQQLSALIATGANVSFTENIAFNTTTPLYVGGGIEPTTLVLSASGGNVTDKGGTLINASGTVVGAVDYANGICTLSSNVFGGSGTLTVAYSRAVNTGTVGNTLGLDVTEATRRSTWVVTLDPNPAPGSLQVSYLAQGHWYVLQDDGSGALRGSDPSFGVGTLNFSTGTVSLTLGALPDSPSEIILAWANGLVPAVAPVDQISGSAAAFMEIDTGFVNVDVGGITITWGGHTVTDSTGAPGTLQGYGTGTIDHATGKIILTPTVIPAPGTVLTVTATNLADQANGTVTLFTDSGSTFTGNMGAGVLAGSLQFYIFGTYPLANADLHDDITTAAFTLRDDAAGNLNLLLTNAAGAQVLVHVGTVNYSTGDYVLNKVTSVTMGQPKYAFGLFNGQWTINYKGQQNRTVNFSLVNGSGSIPAAKYLYNVATLPGSTMNYTLSTMQVKANLSGYPTYTTVAGFPVQGANRYGTVAAGGTFSLTGNNYLAQKDGTLQKNVSRSTGVGTVAGSWASSTGIFSITDWVSNTAPVVTNFSVAENPATAINSTNLNASEATFRTATAPLASAGFSVRGSLADGTTFNVTAAEDGTIHDTHVFGTVNYNTGIITVVFGTADAGPAGSGIRDASDLGIPGVSFIALTAANMDSLIYDAVAYSYIPLNADILGLDPVRLPSDGRVPIFKKGNVAVVHYTHPLAAATYAAGTYDMAQTRLSRIQIVGDDDVTITTGYTVDLDAGHLIISSVSGWAQPAVVSWRIEDMAVVSDAQISGQLTFTRPLSHAYPLGSYVSSAFLIGDVHARNALLFEQSTWTGVWSDTLIGTAPLASYDDINHPVVVTNAAAVTESWALIFTSTTTFEIVGEHLGVLGVSTTSVDCSPLNPNSGTPYFTLAAAGFGTGWSVGNTIRLDTVGALTPLWLARVVQQGDNLLADDSFTTLARGDVNA